VEGVKDLILILEIQIYVPGTIAYAICYISQAGTLKTFFQEDALGRFEDQLAHFFAVDRSF
jgi:hypothetical protein